MKNKSIYALYKGDTFITEGTKEKIAKELNISINTVSEFGSKRYANRYKRNLNRRILIRIDESEGKEWVKENLNHRQTNMLANVDI